MSVADHRFCLLAVEACPLVFRTLICPWLSTLPRIFMPCVDLTFSRAGSQQTLQCVLQRYLLLPLFAVERNESERELAGVPVQQLRLYISLSCHPDDAEAGTPSSFLLFNRTARQGKGELACWNQNNYQPQLSSSSPLPKPNTKILSFS